MKKVFKIGCFGFIGLIVLMAILVALAGGGEDSTETEGTTETAPATEETSTEEDAETEEPVEEEPAEPEVSTEFESALNQAQTYSDTMHMSKAGLFEQLTSEYGGQFPEDAAQYAIDNVDADWKANALESAKTYQDSMSLSKEAIRDQLTSDYGGQFTQEEADYAIENLE
ncbi:Ltp family lipoprotein [Planococcus sp. CP5-4]|uniref:Ltp family lipoprotein n=1 Tax=unclassified Planococcus (in: firmicutes) TaxID=2662419 RepID=UPI001C232BC5|nr:MULTISPECIES: Ltp family lipoprotein [unclassified Planococcus (in: firmicutes)]MBU9673810.1 Ltp family lipoprotein [Planococcus sp. CP5-4_YE]MBV0908938.1 Ltp family lipoprotein [Planococcus sp. CP5-4_UN]MBW6063987.1 Ltp family lipoprotein [Planococcus sp. CP5-4]